MKWWNIRKPYIRTCGWFAPKPPKALVPTHFQARRNHVITAKLTIKFCKSYFHLYILVVELSRTTGRQQHLCHVYSKGKLTPNSFSMKCRKDFILCVYYNYFLWDCKKPDVCCTLGVKICTGKKWLTTVASSPRDMIITNVVVDRENLLLQRTSHTPCQLCTTREITFFFLLLTHLLRKKRSYIFPISNFPVSNFHYWSWNISN